MLSIMICIASVLYRTKALTVIGFATWSQNGNLQSDAEQDALMLEECITKYNVEAIGAATHDELVEMEIENTSGFILIGTCGDSSSCEGRAQSDLVDGHARNCWRGGSTQVTLSSNFGNNCYHSPRATLCVLRSSTSMPSTVPTGWPSSTPTEMPTPIPTEMPTSIPTDLPTQLPTATPTKPVTLSPSFAPTSSPISPTTNPTTVPTGLPSFLPTEMPTPTPTDRPTQLPTGTPTKMVSSLPSETASVTLTPTKKPTELSTFNETFVPTAQPIQETESCPETVGRLEIVIDYLLDYVFCLKHEKDKDNCNGSSYTN